GDADLDDVDDAQLQVTTHTVAAAATTPAARPRRPLRHSMLDLVDPIAPGGDGPTEAEEPAGHDDDVADPSQTSDAAAQEPPPPARPRRRLRPSLLDLVGPIAAGGAGPTEAEEPAGHDDDVADPSQTSDAAAQEPSTPADPTQVEAPMLQIFGTPEITGAAGE